jgi:predicted DNA-binding protein (MmcQ/YjbR family)
MDEPLLLARLREICLTLPESRETVKWGHPTFEAGKKIFAVLDRYQGRPCIAFRLSAERLPMVLADERFYAAPYGARHGWVCMHADGRIEWGEVEGLLRESYRQVALKRMLIALEEASGAPGADQRPPGKRRKTGRLG